MNFLEKLVAEWYSYKGSFVRTNMMFGRRVNGGYAGEMDIAVFNPENNDLLHIETSTDAYSIDERKRKFNKKFKTAKDHYLKLFPWKGNFKQLAIVGLSYKPPRLDIDNVEVKSIPQFMNEVVLELQAKSPTNDAIPESFPLLRAIQYTLAFRISR